MRIGARAGRGRLYAEQGQVLSVELRGTHVEARVLGARPDPYLVKLDFAPLREFAGAGDGGLRRLFGAMTAGRILAGEMPLAVEEMFAAKGMSPYPSAGADRFWCSCPDWSKPCKHIAAVLYILGDAVIRDPFLLLRMRGASLPGESEAAPYALPAWKGREKLEDFVRRIVRRTKA